MGKLSNATRKITRNNRQRVVSTRGDKPGFKYLDNDNQLPSLLRLTKKLNEKNSEYRNNQINANRMSISRSLPELIERNIKRQPLYDYSEPMDLVNEPVLKKRKTKTESKISKLETKIIKVREDLNLMEKAIIKLKNQL